MNYPIRSGPLRGQSLDQVTSLQTLIQYRQAEGNNLNGQELNALNSRIRELHQKGYGNCRPTPNLPQQTHGKAI